MCGIWCAVSAREHVGPNDHTLRLLERRGPDSSYQLGTSCQQACARDQSRTLYLAFNSTVLSLRGEGIVAQPYLDEITGSILSWNGEAWEVAGQPLAGNDTETVSFLLRGAVSVAQDTLGRSEAVQACAERVAKVLARLSGPYAFVYHDPLSGILFFGRDFLGRRSLLTCRTADEDLLVSSVADAQRMSNDHPWSEVEADGVYYVDLNSEDRLITVNKVSYDFDESKEANNTLSVGLAGVVVLARAHGKVGPSTSPTE